MEDNDFTEKDYNRIIDDIINEYFEQHDLNYDYKELLKAQMLGSPEIPSGEPSMPIEPQIEGGQYGR